MSEAASYQMPYSLRRLFATLLVYCNPANPKEIWKFEESMSEDFRVLRNVERKDIEYQVLNQINDILHSMGHNVNEYELIPEIVRVSILEKEAREVFFERTITVSEEDVLLHKKLNAKQLKAYSVIIDRVFSKKPGAFFIDGPGGTGKTFLYRALLATVRSKGYVALATVTSGVAASILPSGRTAHSRFKIPIDIDENFSCNISKQSSTATLIRDAKLIVWDEVSMAKKRMLDVFDLLLKDLMDTNLLFGGKIVILEVTLDKLFQFEKFQLSENTRAKTDPAFCDYLMRIGNGQEKVNSNNKIELSHSLVIPFTTEEESLDHLFAMTFSNVQACSSNSCPADSIS